MKFPFDRFILILLILFQSVSVIESQLLNSVSHVLESITDQKPPATLGQQSPNNTPPHQPSSSSPAPLPPSQTSSPLPTTSQIPPPPPPTQSSSSEKPTTSQKAPDTTTKHNPSPSNSPPTTASSQPPTSNGSPSTADSTPPTTNHPPAIPDVANTTPANVAPSTMPSKPTTSNEDHTTSSQSTTSTTIPSEGGKPKSNKTTKTSTGNSPSGDIAVTSSTASNKNLPSTYSDNNSNGTGSKSGAIVGAVVGTISGVALIAGLLTWGVRKRRHNKRSTDFEDFGLADTDFPNKSPGMRSVGLATNATAMGSTNDPYNSNAQQYYQPQLDAGHMDYSQPIMDYSQQQPQSFYYPQDGLTQNYNSSAFYYDNTAQQPSHSYDINAQYPGVHGDQYYKPDQVDLHHHQRTNM